VKHISPGQRPGELTPIAVVALKGQNNIASVPSFALSGRNGPNDIHPQGVALGWYVSRLRRKNSLGLLSMAAPAQSTTATVPNTDVPDPFSICSFALEIRKVRT
jgi:hypothetical protein